MVVSKKKTVEELVPALKVFEMLVRDHDDQDWIEMEVVGHLPDHSGLPHALAGLKTIRGRTRGNRTSAARSHGNPWARLPMSRARSRPFCGMGDLLVQIVHLTPQAPHL